MNKIICISRECGCGGEEIAARVGSQLHIPVYENAEPFLHYHGSGIIPLNTVRLNPKREGLSLTRGDYSTNPRIFQMQSEEIKRLAMEENCIFLGRCADWVLRDEDVSLLRVFITASAEDCIQRILRLGETSKVRARRFVRQINLLRMEYYNTYTGKRWGSPKNYDLVINSSETGVEGAVKLISDIYEKMPF